MKRDNLLVISDLHLGIPALTGPGGEEKERTDRELVAFLNKHREERVDRRPWRLVIDGDMMEFMRAAPPTHDAGGQWTERNIKPILHALDSIFESHRSFFQALADFVGAGNSLVIVRGNHDPELQLAQVRRHFLKRLLDLAHPSLPYYEEARFLRRVSFEPFAYHEPKALHIEHGHMYDHFAAWQDDNGGFASDGNLPLGTRVVRDVCNLFPGVNFFNMESWGLFRYLGWLLSRDVPWSSVLRLPMIYARMVIDLLKSYWAQAKKKRLQSPHGPVRRLVRVWVRPGYMSLSKIAGAVYLDRLIVFSLVFLVTFLGARHSWLLGLSLGAACAIAGELFGRWVLTRYRLDSINARLRSASRKVSKALRVPVVIFGHTHRPECSRDSSGRLTYINLGHWLAGSPDLSTQRFVFAKILRKPGKANEISVHVWCADRGALPFRTTAAKTSPSEQEPGGLLLPA